MRRILVALAVAAVLGAAVWFLYGPIDGWPSERRMLLVSVITLALSVVAAIAALRAFRRTAALGSDLTALARSIDLALRDFAQRSTKDVATIGEMNEHVARELEKIATNLLAREDTPTARSAPTDNVVALPPTRRLRQTSGDQIAGAAGERDAVEMAYRRALAAETFELSLQPIVSVSLSAAAGFEAFANLPVDGRDSVNIRRLAETLPGIGSAAFERILVNRALEAGRRRLGAAGADMPVHVAVSDALVTDAPELEAVLDTTAIYPELARSVVMSLPIALFDKGGPARHGLTRLGASGIRLAAEGWIEGVDDASALANAGVSFLKISANRLLDREKSRRKLGPAASIVEAATLADITVIATNVATDEDAVSLIDLGLDLMVGERFSGPRRLKPEGDRPSRLALI